MLGTCRKSYYFRSHLYNFIDSTRHRLLRYISRLTLCLFHQLSFTLNSHAASFPAEPCYERRRGIKTYPELSCHCRPLISALIVIFYMSVLIILLFSDKKRSLWPYSIITQGQFFVLVPSSFLRRSLCSGKER